MNLTDLENIEMTIRVGFGQSWQLGQQVQDIAQKIGVDFIGGSSESGQLFYRAKGSKIGQFRSACAAAGFVASIS